MNSDAVNQFIQGVGVMTEIWTITYQSFKRQGMNDAEAVEHTKAFMSVFIDSFIDKSDTNNKEDKHDPS